MKTVRWITSVQQADTIKQKWDDNSKDLHYLKWYFTKECIDTLKKYVDFASSVLKKIGTETLSETHGIQFNQNLLPVVSGLRHNNIIPQC